MDKSILVANVKKAFDKPFGLALHIRTVHYNKKWYRCEQCEREFTNESALNDHIGIVHNSIGYQCQHCKKFFATTKSLEDHIIQQKKFLNVNNVENISRVHEGFVKYRCDICDKH